MLKPASSSTIRNSTCRHVGHDWKPSLSHRYRTCQREHCRAAERLEGSTWVPVTSKPVTRSHPAASTALLWNRQQFDALTFPYPGYDPVRERELEQRYYKAVADERVYRAAHQQKGGY